MCICTVHAPEFKAISSTQMTDPLEPWAHRPHCARGACKSLCFDKRCKRVQRLCPLHSFTSTSPAMSDEGSSSTNPPAETPVASGSRSTASTSAAPASGSIGSLQTPTATPAGRLSSLRGGRGGLGAGSISARGGPSKVWKVCEEFELTKKKKRQRQRTVHCCEGPDFG